MPVHNPTLSELVGSGYAELDVHCGHCRGLVCLSLENTMRRRGQMTTIKDVESRLKCSRCGNPPASVTAKLPGRHGGYGP